MKSLYESSTHTRIHKQKEKDKTAVRLGQITGDRAIRILTDTLTAGELRERRLRAGIKKKTQPIQKETPVEMEKEIENPPITPEALREWLSELGEVKIRQNEDNSWGASIHGVTLENCLYGTEKRSRGEIRGDNPDQALRNYFGCTITPGTHMQKGEKQYRWSHVDLAFIKNEKNTRRNTTNTRARIIRRRRHNTQIERITALLEAMPEARVVEFLDSLGECAVNDTSFGRNFSGNESYDVRFEPDIRDAADNPYMGFGNTAGEAKRDLLKQLILDGEIDLDLMEK